MDSCKTPSSNNCNDFSGICSKSSEPSSVKIRKNNVTTRIVAKHPLENVANHFRSHFSSTPDSEFHYCESPTSSPMGTSTLISGNTISASDRNDGSNNSRPNYMNLTESIRAKQRACNSQKLQNQALDDFQFHEKASSKPVVMRVQLDKASMRLKESCNYYSERPSSMSLGCSCGSNECLYN